mgnify:CR=1 FL=1
MRDPADPPIGVLAGRPMTAQADLVTPVRVVPDMTVRAAPLIQGPAGQCTEGQEVLHSMAREDRPTLVQAAPAMPAQAGPATRDQAARASAALPFAANLLNFT